MELPTEIRFVDEKIREDFYSLASGDGSERDLFMQIEKAMDNIKRNAFCGIQIPKRLIPDGFNVHNLWKCNLDDSWRLLYSIETDDKIAVSIILCWLSHKEYERKFKY